MLSLVLAVVVSTPTISVDRALLNRAHRAMSDSKEAEAKEAIRGWISVQPFVESLPGPFEPWSGPLLAEARLTGPLRIFGSRMSDRIRIGLQDPANVVGRVHVYIHQNGKKRLLDALDSHTVDRREYGGVGEISDAAKITVEAYLAWPDEEVMIRRIDILPSALTARPRLPKLAPDSAVLTSSAAEAVCDPSKGEDCEDEPWLWAWIFGVLAVGLAGASVWQEAKWRP